MGHPRGPATLLTLAPAFAEDRTDSNEAKPAGVVLAMAALARA